MLIGNARLPGMVVQRFGPYRRLPRPFAEHTYIRHFASEGTDQFRETLEKMKKKSTKDTECNDTHEGSTDPEAAESEGAQKEPPTSASPDVGRMVNKVTDFMTDSYVTVKDNIRMAWADLTGESKQTTLRKTVMQAESFRRGGEVREDTEEAEKYEGTTAIVVVKDQGSAWDQMKARLSSSPLIREMLKNTRNVTKAAAETDIGKKAVETGQNIKDKVEVSM